MGMMAASTVASSAGGALGDTTPGESISVMAARPLTHPIYSHLVLVVVVITAHSLRPAAYDSVVFIRRPPNGDMTAQSLARAEYAVVLERNGTAAYSERPLGYESSLSSWSKFNGETRWLRGGLWSFDCVTR